MTITTTSRLDRSTLRPDLVAIPTIRWITRPIGLPDHCSDLWSGTASIWIYEDLYEYYPTSSDYLSPSELHSAVVSGPATPDRTVYYNLALATNMVTKVNTHMYVCEHRLQKQSFCDIDKV